MIFTRPKIACYLESTSLTIFWLRLGKQERFVFPEASIKFSHVIDPKLLSQSLDKFLGALRDLDGTAVLFLAPELVFYKEVRIAQAVDTNDLLEEWLPQIPIEKESIVSMVTTSGQNHGLFAANRDFYELIKDSLAVHGIHCQSVVPILPLVGKLDASRINVSSMRALVSNGAKLGRFNFLGRQTVIDGHPDQAKTRERQAYVRRQYLMLLASILIAGGTLAYLAMWSGVLPNPFFKYPGVLADRESLLIEQPPTPLPTPAIDMPALKSTLKLSIRNGTRVAGEAGRVALVFKSEGFENVVTGNAGNTDEPKTIQYGPGVPGQMLQEIERVLQQNYPDLDYQTASMSGNPDFDVIITTGK